MLLLLVRDFTFTPACYLRVIVTGNLLNSLMGSGEEEEGEEAQEDSSPIELD